MAARKRAALERMGSLGERHRVSEIDALRDDDGPGSLAAVVAELDPGAGAGDHHRGPARVPDDRRGRRDLAPVRPRAGRLPARPLHLGPAPGRRGHAAGAGRSGCCSRRSCAAASTCTSTMPREAEAALRAAGFADGARHAARWTSRARGATPERDILSAITYSGGINEMISDHAVQRSGLPLGLLGEPGAPGDRVALRRPARLAPGARRADRGGLPVRGARLHPDAGRRSGRLASASATGCRSRPRSRHG